MRVGNQSDDRRGTTSRNPLGKRTNDLLQQPSSSIIRRSQQHGSSSSANKLKEPSAAAATTTTTAHQRHNNKIPKSNVLVADTGSVAYNNENGKGSATATTTATTRSSSGSHATTTTTTVLSPNINKGRSFAGFRQALRQTVSPRPTPREKRSTSSVAAAAAVNMTPMSLLSRELESDDAHHDESLLLSPLPPPRAFTATSFTATMQPQQLQQPAQIVHRPISHDAKKTKLDSATKRLSTVASVPSMKRNEMITTTTSCTHTAPETTVACDKPEATTKATTSTTGAAAVTSEKPPAHRKGLVIQPASLKVPSDQQEQQPARSLLSSCVATSTKSLQSVPEENVIWNAIDPGYRSPSTPAGAICLDLSDMFSVAKAAPLTTTTNSVVASIRPNRMIPRRPAAPKQPKVVENVSEDWAERHQEMFTNWFNHTLVPDSSVNGADDDQAAPPIQSEDRLALRALRLHQQMASARSLASALFHGPDMEKIRKVVTFQIAKGKIAIRDDRNLYADLIMRKQIVELLLSYSTPWLRLGLETVLGQVILPESPQQHFSPPPPAKNDNNKTRQLIRKQQQQHQQSSKVNPMRLALKKFIIQRVLSDEATLEKYTMGKCIVPSGQFDVQYQADMRTLVLYRLLVLFFFLDRAKQANIFEEAPRLFRIDSSVKSSQEVLLAFSRHFLSGEGNFIKHLQRVSLKVSYKQEPIEEVNFAVTNMASDLRDGVRLTRVAEILTGVPRKSLLDTLRLPAGSRLQKLYNVGVALKALRDFGVPIPEHEFMAHHVVDAHREIVLKLIWFVVAHCCLNNLVDVDQVKAEIRRIERLQTLKSRVGTEATTSAALVATEATQQDHLQRLLLHWCRAVCSTFRIGVNNLTTDFADGRALCLLIHYYHPNLLCRSEILKTTNDLRATEIDETRLARLRGNERSNAALANSRMSELGGIPKMVPAMDTTCAPDENSIFLCLSYMFSRLLESKLEIRSCVLIQRRYRRYRQVVETERKHVAASFILKTWRARRLSYFKAQRDQYGNAVNVIERFALAHKANLERRRGQRLSNEAVRNRAAIPIQACMRRFLASHLVALIAQKTRAAVVCQSYWRCLRARRHFLSAMERRDAAARTIQTAWSRFRMRSSARTAAAVTLQRIWRGFSTQILYFVDVADVRDVQRCVRRFLAIRQLRQRRHAVKVIHRSVASYLCKKAVELKRVQFSASIMCQRVIRGHLARTYTSTLRKNVNTCTMIQTLWRGYRAKSRLLEWRDASCLIQAAVRGRRERNQYFRKQKACSCIQLVWRVFLARRKFQKQIITIVQLQAHVRRYLAALEADRRRRAEVATTVIQASFRAYSVRRSYRRMLLACLLIQASVRGHNDKCRYLYLRECALLIQTEFRRRKQQAVYQTYLRSACRVQRYWRGHVVRASNLRKRNAAIIIQSVVRIILSRCSNRRETAAAITVQRFWRGFSTCKNYSTFVSSILTIQRGLRLLLAVAATSKRRDAVRCLQQEARRTLARQTTARLKAERLRRVSSCMIIQKTYRGYLLRHELGTLQSCALKIQSAFRCYLALTQYKYDREDVIFAQSLARMWIGKREASRRNESVILLQSSFRRHLAKELYAGLRLAHQEHSTKEAAACRIQSIWRSYIEHADYLISMIQILRIQSHMRGYIGRLHSRNRLAAVIKIQKFSRWVLQRLHEQRICFAVTLLQSSARMIVARAAFSLQKRSAVAVQRTTRGFIARLELTTWCTSACSIQRTWRGYKAFREFVDFVVASVTIQSVIRTFLAKARAVTLRLDMIATRREQAAQKIQSVARCFRLKSAVRNLVRGVVCCQALTRGYLVRSRRTKKVAAQASRVAKANLASERDPSLRLGNRTKSALAALLKIKRLVGLHAVISTLEMSTRLSPNCCNDFAEAGASDVFFTLITECNRSEPNCILVYTMLRTMSNVAFHDSLLPCVASTRGVEKFLYIIPMYRDKDGILFLAASLLERVLRFNGECRALCSQEETLKHLRSVLILSNRKFNVSAARRLSVSDSKSMQPPKGIRALRKVILFLDPASHA